MAWENPFGNNLIPISNSSLAEYATIAPLAPFLLSWPSQNLTNPIATNNLFTGIGTSVALLPPVALGPQGFACYVVNNTAANMPLAANDGTILYTLPIGGVLEMILANPNSTTEAAGWRVVPMNVGNLTITNPASVAGPTVGVNSFGQLYTKENVVYIDVSTFPAPIDSTATYPILALTGNDLYVANLTPCTFVLTAATQNDVGKTIAFKNMTAGVVNVVTPTGSYYIDYNLSTDVTGFASILVSPDETVMLSYGGALVNGANSYNMYYIISRMQNNSALMLENTIGLPTTPPPVPTTLSVNSTAADVIYFTDVDPSNPSNGIYNFFVPYPIPKVYYLAVNTVLNTSSISIQFQSETDPLKLATLNANAGMVIIFVDENGYVTESNPIVNVAYATTEETIAGASTTKAVTPAGLAAWFTFYTATPAQINAGVSDNTIMTPLAFGESIFITALRGTIAIFGGATAPAGTQICDGSPINQLLYPNAYAQFGPNLPDLRGYFLRANDNGAGIDPGRTLGSIQGDQNLTHSHAATLAMNPPNITATQAPHSHILTNPSAGSSGAGTGLLIGVSNGGVLTTNAQAPAITVTAATETGSVAISAEGGSESRPVNISVNYIMFLFN